MNGGKNLVNGCFFFVKKKQILHLNALHLLVLKDTVQL
jgi:hypothetical protein